MSQRTLLLRLSNSGEPENSEGISNGIYILPALPHLKGYKKGDPLFHLVFQLNAASSVTRDGTLLTNLPKDSSSPFKRHEYSEYLIGSSFDKDASISVPIFRPGSYNYFIRYTDANDTSATTEKFYFNVPPALYINGEYVAFNALNVETVVSKWVGSLSNWETFFTRVADKGYNMIHFTPLQERGSSDSPYSIYDQLQYDPKIFKDNSEAISVIKKLLANHGLLSLTDVVWNHTADNSEWLREYPDSGYNAETAPHLTAAIELDASLLEFSRNLKSLSLPTEINNEHDLHLVVDGISQHVIGKLQLWQYYVFNKEDTLAEIKKNFYDSTYKITPVDIPTSVNKDSIEELATYTLEVASVHGQPILEKRFSNKLDARKFLGILYTVLEARDLDFEVVAQKSSAIIDQINAPLYSSYDDDVKSILSQVSDRIKFLRLAGNGPKLGLVTDKNPLTEAYFTRFTGKDGKSWALANNGWIWGGNPLVDFASSKSKAYLRREVIVWSDCVKLRYGSGPSDSPHLWERMIQYTQDCARTFSGFRIDNCHSTPLHVGEALLDAAREVNSNLYVVAELFTGSEEMDKFFVERLGINTLIREAMQAWNVQELSRLVHKHGGRPIGSLTWLPLDDFALPADKEPTKGKYIDSYTEMEIPKVLTKQAPHAMFMDCTHDNEMPAQKRTPEDTLPNAALVAFCSSAIGSVYGYDEIFPRLLDVVNETRQYSIEDNGIGQVKKKLHAIRKNLAAESEDILRDHEMYIHHEGQYITIQRHNAKTGKGWFLIARSKFDGHEGPQTLSPVVLSGTIAKCEFSYTLKVTGEYQHSDTVLTGIPAKVEEIRSPAIEFNGKETIIKVDDSFITGSIAVFSTEIPGVDLSLDKFVKEGAVEASLGLDLSDLNALLYRCSSEERDASFGKEDVYSIPGYGALVYAGLEGWNTALKHVIWQNNLGHPICDHIRQGEWALDYIVNRLDIYSKNSPNLKKFQEWLRSRIEAIKKVPYFLRPHYFTLVVGIAYEAARFRALRGLGVHVQTATNFVQSLALTSVQMIGRMNNTSLLPTEQVSCIAAGLPHFSNDYMRCWGRDVFISFRGLMLVTERYDDAKNHILGFAKTLKHGLIPNLLDAGRNPRYNARDAVWFFLQAIQEYVKYAPDGIKILDERVARRFPLDDTYIPHTDKRAFSYESSIREVIYEILARHAKGIKYREANAGPNLDSQMKDEGFNVEVYIDWKTGLVHGGSQSNCGTWMDKMGESEKAGSKGVPGTPRDGAAIELQGLMKSALRFVNELNTKGSFEYTEVEKNDGSKISLVDWEKLVQDNFEKHFFIPVDASDDDKFVVDASLVNRRGIYKDLYRSGKPYEDYQLRANFPIAMVAAPELFTPKNALAALRTADRVIRGPVGLRTLDPSDWNYRPYYNNSEDSEDFATSKGRNYHQGPEWVWVFGYFLRAFMLFHYIEDKSCKTESGELTDFMLTGLNARIQGHQKWIKESPWAGLTELTNKDGAFCYDSSPTQAWSTSCLLDLYYDLWSDEHYKNSNGRK
ncbi:glycogen debranching enzyme [Scheffersomyces stipitis CBS 6054]|uniref:Glycogen debranching enzyme n=1 Tax=Scheffersomyces stipitis (strain ATCC 58785 / CBS 6054 / NBRC 10063 / NRRL Y-11545) TaxID=322104 RepID=A3GF70_PICST|nr:glycogen debranching enzyme [Scheffersomyces stipitis CBS 6054]EAZ63299.2 glycogen debranching enzyme [Scheffersomyces stipitis CBS 6054]